MALHEKVWFWVLMLSILLIVVGIIYFFASSNPQFWWVLVWLGVLGIIFSIFISFIEGAGETVSKVVTSQTGQQAIIQGVQAYQGVSGQMPSTPSGHQAIVSGGDISHVQVTNHGSGGNYQMMQQMFNRGATSGSKGLVSEAEAIAPELESIAPIALL